MVERSLEMAAQATGGRLEGVTGEARWRGAVLDSRQLTGGELFFALPGGRADGHDFVDVALAGGAAAAVVRRAHTATAGSRLLRVADPYDALHDLTRAVRRTTPRRLVAVTGSTGKTSTKELLAALLGRRFRVARSPGNLNNLLGFPLSLLAVPDDCEWMVAEMGMSEPGELARVSRLGRPDIVVLLNVRPVHLEHLPDLAAVAAAKAEILEGLETGGRVVANADDSQLRRVLAGTPHRVIWFGTAPPATVRAEDVGPAPEGRPGSRFRLVTPVGECWVELALHGAYQVENFLAAAAVGLELGLDLADLAAAAAEARPAERRGRVHRTAGGWTLIDDSYNANPVAVAAALAAAATLPGERHWAVLGSMLELGTDSARYHRDAGGAAVAFGFDPVWAVGEEARELAAGVREAGGRGRWFATAAEAAAAAPKAVAPGDVVLVKGSRGVALEVVATVLGAADGAGDRAGEGAG